MVLGWIEESYSDFRRARNERLPSVHTASHALNAVVGIQAGTRMIGAIAIMLWEMPEPPAQSMQDIVARFHTKLNAVNAKPAATTTSKPEPEKDDASESDDTVESDDSDDPENLLWFPRADGEDDPEDYFELIDFGEETSSEDDEDDKADGADKTKENASQLPHSEHDTGTEGKLKESPSLVSSPRATTIAKKPKAVIDLTDSPDTSLPEESSSLKPHDDVKKTTSELCQRPASPPPDWVPNTRTRPTRNILACWNHNLSKNINRWLEQPGTKSCQIQLSRLELRSLSFGLGARPYKNLHAKNHDKLKISRMTIPKSASQGTAQPQSHDWLVIQVSNNDSDTRLRDDDSSESDDSETALPRPIETYWLLSFPLQAITESKTDMQRVPASPLPACPQNRRPSKKTQPTERVQYVTKLVLGIENRVPFVHGRGVDPRFAQGFIEACAEGEGVIELASLEPLSQLLGECE